MKLRQLEAMRALMTKGTTIQAADSIGLTQSAVSRLISQLEDELGLELFYRRQGRLVATPEGQQLFEVAQRILSDIDRVTSVARDIASLRRGAIRIIAMPAYGFRLLPEAIKRVRERFKQVKIVVEMGGRFEVEEALRKETCDLALATLPIDASGGGIEPLGTLEAVCVMPPDCDLTSRDVVTPDCLGGIPFISVEPHSMLRLSTDQLFGRLSVNRNLLIEAHSATMACSLVAKGLGVSIVHPFIGGAFQDRLVVRPFRPAVHFEYGLIFPAERRRSLIANEMVAVLKQEAGDLTGQVKTSGLMG